MPRPDAYQPQWFVIKGGDHAGEWHLAGWQHSAIKGEDLSIPGGGQDLTGGWLSYGNCPRCRAMVVTDDRHVYGDQQWAHEQWHHLTDYPHPTDGSTDAPDGGDGGGDGPPPWRDRVLGKSRPGSQSNRHQGEKRGQETVWFEAADPPPDRPPSSPGIRWDP